MSAPLSLTITVADTVTLMGDVALQLSSSVPANRAASFVIQQQACTAASGVCCVADIDAAEATFDFGRLAPTAMDRSRIRYLLPPLPTEGTLSLLLRAASGQTCQAILPTNFSHIAAQKVGKPSVRPAPLACRVT